jgi:hypothetical protein
MVEARGRHIEKKQTGGLGDIADEWRYAQQFHMAAQTRHSQ